MSQSRSSFAEYAANNSPFSQFDVTSRVNVTSHQAYNTFVNSELRGLSGIASTGAQVQPSVLASAFPLSLPGEMPLANSPTFKLQMVEVNYLVPESTVNLADRSNLAFERFREKQNVTDSALFKRLEKSSLTAMTITGLRTANNLVDGLGGFIKHKLRLTNLTLDIYDRTNTAVESGFAGSTSVICGTLGGVSRTVSTVTGYGFVVSEGLLLAGSTSGAGLIPATIFVSSALPAVDIISNGIGDVVETACQRAFTCLDKPDQEERISPLDLELNVLEHELFIMSLNAIKMAVPDDLSTCDYPTLKATSESVTILKDMVQSMQLNGLKTSDVYLGDLSQEMNIIEEKFNQTVRECVLKRIHNQSVSKNSSVLFAMGRQLPISSISSSTQIKKL